VADKNRGGRSADDEEFDDAELVDDEFDGDESADADDEGDDDETRSRAESGGRSRTAVRSKASAGAGTGFFGRIGRFVREIVAELQKVIWPTRKELLTYTTVVVIFVAIMMTFVSLLDVGFAKAMFLVFGSETTN